MQAFLLFFSCVCAKRGDQTCFFAFLGVKEARSEPGSTRHARPWGGTPRPPRACLRSPEKRGKITSVIQAKFHPVTETFPSGRSSNFLGTRLRDP